MRHDEERQVGTLSNVLGFEDYEKSPKGGNFLPFFCIFFAFWGKFLKKIKDLNLKP
jgi:hypothetical protein